MQKTQIILEIILLIIGCYIAFFKSYFTEKGKNIATKEDIDEITEIVETVKNQFIEKNTYLKAKLDLLTNIQINQENEKRNAIINLHKTIRIWSEISTNLPTTLLNKYDNTEINKQIDFYTQSYIEVLKAESLLELYINEEKLTVILFNLKDSILQNLAYNYNETLLNFEKNNNKLSKLKLEDNLINDRRKLLLKERRDIFDDYTTKTLEGLKKTGVFQQEYLNYMRYLISKVESK